jgi:hydroxyacylglutathione hydrolase
VLFRQYYLGCLSHASYFVGDETTGVAVVVDPQRDVDAYVADAEAAGLRIAHVIETHVHADFVSGHLELAARTGADICYGEPTAADFHIRQLHDGERLSLGQVVLEVRATPGHTPESISLVVWEHDDDDVPYGVLTGDTLFIGDVGRPDLLAAHGTSAEELAQQLHRSLRTKLMTLPDATRVFPPHGAGSACGKHLSTETVSTIGDQRRGNYALAPMTEAQFVEVVLEGQAASPPYFPYSASQNLALHPLLAEEEPPPALSVDDVLAVQRAGGAVLDARSPADFAAGHLRGSVNVGLEGRFAEYAGDVLRPDRPVAVVCEPGHELEVRTRLGRIGFDQVVGCLADPVAVLTSRPDLVEPSSRLTPDQLARRMDEVPDLVLVDVRNPAEVAGGAIPGAVNVPLPALAARAGDLDPSRPTVVYCAGGFRSSIAASFLGAEGFADVSDLMGGYGGWSAWQSTTGAGAPL